MGPAGRPLTGVGVYVTELAAGLDALRGDRVRRLGIRPGGPFQPHDPGANEPQRAGRHLAWVLGSADREARAAGCDLVHYTNAVAPLRTTAPFVLTVHDLSIVRWPSSHPIARLAIVPIMLSAARRARRIIVPSAATAREIRRLLRVPSRRIEVIPHAARQAATEALDEGALDRLGLTRNRYLLALGTIEPRKNHVRLLAAFERAAVILPHHRLVLVGAPGWRGGRFRRALDRSPVADRVMLTGHLPDSTVAALLRSSSVMIYPSLYEGYGLPIIEAMAAGVPVVTSRVSSMPEVAGGAAVLVDPLDVAAIASGIQVALERRDELAAAGRARAAGRTWRDVALETLAVYDEALRIGA